MDVAILGHKFQDAASYRKKPGVLTPNAASAERMVKLHRVHFEMSCTANMLCAATYELM